MCITPKRKNSSWRSYIMKKRNEFLKAVKKFFILLRTKISEIQANMTQRTFKITSIHCIGVILKKRLGIQELPLEKQQANVTKIPDTE